MDNKLTPWLIRVHENQTVKDGPIPTRDHLVFRKDRLAYLPSRCNLTSIGMRDSHPGPLFMFQDGCMLIHQTFGILLDNVLDQLHLNLSFTASELELQL